MDDIVTASSGLTSDRASPTAMSPRSSEDITAAEKADLSSVPLEDVTPEGVMEDNIDASPGPSLEVRAGMRADLSSATVELVDVEDKEVTPEEKEDAVSKPSTTNRASRRKVQCPCCYLLPVLNLQTMQMQMQFWQD